ncbi:hypothetical protein PV08_07559 [Exophiala spinifera]|uniref:Ornithine cyclodeaminase n=1 Tax=Exophiala spinifera TaxID=91928 RepID=A0A0D2BU14_9EURO|nr:uncharacterized protein PV08_07559 [Exophiala spinifera]KIW14774.1 hypothetical protein PV08_07559 [Exophiala spinifera]
MPLTVLTEADIRTLLLSLAKEDAATLQRNLAEALHSYSTGDTNSPCSASSQPHRTIIKKNGMTTLFMPASTGTAVGMKIVSLEQQHDTSHGKKSSMSSLASQSTTGSAAVKSPTGEFATLSLTPASTMSSGSRDSIDGASFRPPASISSAQSSTPRGSVTVLDPRGNPVGIVNAEELTAFRTALASTMLFQKRQNVHTMTVFGAGKQAYWHIRLALLFKGDEVRHVNIINRSFERSIKLMKTLQMEQNSHGFWRKDIKYSCMSPEFGEYGRLLKEEVRKADVIFCCTPSLDPLFPAEFLTSREGQKKGRYISCIGSYAPHMVELHPDVFRLAVQPDHGHHHHKHARQGGVIVVDNLESCLKDSGEIIKAKLGPEHLVEIGELMMIKKSADREIELGGSGEPGLLEWLTRGNVIYKSVGMGLMDLIIAEDMIRLARERDVGVTIEDF